MGKLTENAVEIGECLAWRGNLAKYGTTNWEGKTRKVPRLVFELENGPIDPGMLVCHKCDNPGCIKLEHLFLGTPSDNMRDMVSKNRHAKTISCRQDHFKSGHAPRGENGSGAKLTEAQAKNLLSDKRGGLKTKQLAEKYGIHRTTVQRLVRGQNWKCLNRNKIAGRAALKEDKQS